MLKNRLREVRGRPSAWWLRASVLRPKDIRAIGAIISEDGVYSVMAGPGPDNLRRVDVGELFELEPNERRDIHLYGKVHMVIGSFTGPEALQGPMIRDGATDRPQLVAIPVNRYLLHHTMPRFPSHLLPYFLVPGLITLSAALVAILTLYIAPETSATLYTAPVAGSIAIVIATINERRKWRSDSPPPPPHRLAS